MTTRHFRVSAAIALCTVVGAVTFQNCGSQIQVTPLSSNSGEDLLTSTSNAVTGADIFAPSDEKVKIASIRQASLLQSADHPSSSTSMSLTALIDNQCLMRFTERPSADSLARAIYENYSPLSNLNFQATTFVLPPAMDLESLPNHARTIPCLIEITHASAGTRNQTIPPSEPLHVAEPSTPWVEAMGFKQAWQTHSLQGSHPVVVAVIDSGVDTSHPDLNQKLVLGRNLGGSTAIDMSAANPASPVPDNDTRPIRQNCSGGNHGTGVAGVVAMATGLRDSSAPASLGAIKIMPVRVDTPIRYGNSGILCAILPATAINAILFAADHPDVDVINFSMSFFPNESMERAIAYAVARGKLFVHSAGNNGQSNSSMTPHGIPNRTGLIGVGGLVLQSILAPSTSSTAVNSFDFTIDSYSNRGIYVPIAAISEPVTTLSWDHNTIVQEGTSFSAPMVAGAAALAIQILKEQNRAYTPESIKSLILQSALHDSRFNALTAGEGRILDAASMARQITSSFPQRCTTPLTQEQYLQTYPDVAAAGVNPFLHYQASGRLEGRCPVQGACSIPISNEEYLALYTDVARAGLRARYHYNSHGRNEGRCPVSDNERFSPEDYLAANRDLSTAFSNDLTQAAEHFCKYVVRGTETRPLRPGGRLFRFNAEEYLDANPDVRTAGVNAADHLCSHGIRERRTLR